MGLDIDGAFFITAPSSTTLSMDGTVANVMKVNADGVLTRPQTPFMRGQLTGFGGVQVGQDGSPLKITADVQLGGCWNQTTGLWTCPVTGYYMMTGGNIAGINSGYLHLYKNGVSQHFTHWSFSVASWTYVNLSGVIYAAAGDTLSYRLSGLGPGTNGFYGGGAHGMYSIALMV